MLVGLAFGHQHKIAKILVFLVGIRQHRQWPLVHTPEVARVTGVPAAIRLGSSLQQEDARTSFGGLDGGAKRGITAADHDHIPRGARYGSVLSAGHFDLENLHVFVYIRMQYRATSQRIHHGGWVGIGRTDGCDKQQDNMGGLC